MAKGGERLGTAAAGGCGCALVAALIVWLQILGLGEVTRRVGLSPTLILALSAYIALVAVYATMMVGIIFAFAFTGMMRTSGGRVGIACLAVYPLSVLIVMSTAISLSAWHNSELGGITFTTPDKVSVIQAFQFLIETLWNDIFAYLPGVNPIEISALESENRLIVDAFVGAAMFVAIFALLAPPAYALMATLRAIFGRRSGSQGS